MLIILQKETNFLKKTLPRLQHSPERAELLIRPPEELKNPGSCRLLTEESGLYVI